jgi:TonB family protein
MGWGLIATLMIGAWGQVAAEAARPLDECPDYVTQPQPEYPVLAAIVGQSGSVTLQCDITLDGLATGCVPVREVPTDMGFAASAIAAMADARFEPGVRDGAPARLTVHVPVHFMLPPPESPVPYIGPEPDEAALAELRTFVRETMPQESAIDGLIIDLPHAARVIEIVHSVEAEFVEAKIEVAARAFGRSELADDVWDDSMLDIVHRLGEAIGARVRQLYCAEYDCTTPEPRTATPGPDAP